MEILGSLVSNWKKLDKLLTSAVSAINLRTPRKGNGILLTESPSGCLISIDPQVVQTKTAKTADGQTGGGGPVTWNNVGWTTVTLIDPATCTQSQIQVLTQQNGSSVQIQ